MKPLIPPTPNLNGNTGTSLINQLTGIMSALDQVNKAFASASDIIHGRNFQTLKDGDRIRNEAEIAWIERRIMIEQLHNELLRMALSIQGLDNR